MTLPTLRLSFLRSSPYLPSIARTLAGRLRGRVLVLPNVLGRQELEEVVDALTLLLGLPVYIFAQPTGMEEMVGHGPGGILVLPVPLEVPPDPVRNSIVVCVRAQSAEDMSIGMPSELLLLRDAIIECLTRQLEQTRLAAIPGWVASVADTPATAIRFVDGVQMRHLLEPDADDATLFCAGLAAVVGWMMQPVDSTVAQWMLSIAASPAEPERLVSADAALLGRAEALNKAFESGLVYQLPPQEGGSPDLRRPLGAITWLGSAPGAPPLSLFVTQLASQVSPAVRSVLTRLARPPVRGLGLSSPAPPVPMVGRNDLLERLSTLLEPGDRVRTCILYGAFGSGRSSAAAALTKMLESRLEPVWVHFNEGPEAGWLRVASALGIDINRDRGERSDIAPWVQAVHEQLKQNAYLVIVDAVETVPEWELPNWLPRDTGRCAVLVISRTAQHALQRSHEAISVQMPPLTVEEARELFMRKVPQLQQEIARGDADRLIDRLGRYPGAIVLSAPLVAAYGIGPVFDRFASGSEGMQGAMPRLVRDAIEPLRGLERQLLLGLSVTSPSGSTHELALCVGEIPAGQEAVIDRLLERGLIVRESRLLRLHGFVRGAAERMLDEDLDNKRRLSLLHAAALEDLIAVADETGDQGAKADLYNDLVLAVKRTAQLCASGYAEAFETSVDAAVDLSAYPVGGRAKNLTLAIEAFRAALSVRPREQFAESWAAVQANLGSALMNLPSSANSRPEHLRQAIEAFAAALSVHTKDLYPERFAHAHYKLGTAFMDMQGGDRADQVQRAIEHFRQALSVYTYETHPEFWAMVQGQLGVALSQMPTGDRNDYMQKAMEAFRNALALLSRETHPEEWAAIQGHIGFVYSQLQAGDRGENLRQAVMAYGAALSVFTYEYFPEEWARTHMRLGTALLELNVGDPNERLKKAIESLRAALAVYTQKDYPQEWALLQFRLGSALAELPSGDRMENLAMAADALRASLTLLSRKDAPADWAMAQNNLGLSLMQLTTGDRAENLRQATQAFRGALTIYTRESYPQRWALVQRNLAKAYASLPTGELADSSSGSMPAASSGRNDSGV